jgi:hypothetical protein
VGVAAVDASPAEMVAEPGGFGSLDESLQAPQPPSTIKFSEMISNQSTTGLCSKMCR